MYLLVLSNEQPHYTHWFSTVVGVWHRVDVLLDPVVEISSPLWNPQLEHRKSASPSLYTNTHFYVTGYFTISPHCGCSGWLANSRSSPRSTSRPTLITSCRQYSSLRNLLLTQLPFPSTHPSLSFIRNAQYSTCQHSTASASIWQGCDSPCQPSVFPNRSTVFGAKSRTSTESQSAFLSNNGLVISHLWPEFSILCSTFQ